MFQQQPGESLRAHCSRTDLWTKSKRAMRVRTDANRKTFIGAAVRALRVLARNNWSTLWRSYHHLELKPQPVQRNATIEFGAVGHRTAVATTPGRVAATALVVVSARALPATSSFGQTTVVATVAAVALLGERRRRFGSIGPVLPDIVEPRHRCNLSNTKNNLRPIEW